jgi:phospho-N-acetylmuramoyl-pentapeptide-transferase
MLYHLLTSLAETHIFFNLFNYLTFRTGLAIMTSLVICFIIAKPMINWLKLKQKEGQPIRKDGPETHLSKERRPWAD